MHNHSHGLNQGVEEELAIRVELSWFAPVQSADFGNVHNVSVRKQRSGKTDVQTPSEQFIHSR